MSEIYKAPEAQLYDQANTGEYGSLESGLAGSYELKPTKIIRQAWDMMLGFKGKYWLAIIIYMVISGIIGAASTLFVPSLEQQILDSDSITTWQIIAQVLVQLVSFFITIPLTAGMFMMCLKHSVNAPTRAEQVVKYFDKAVPLFLTTLLMYFLILLGLALFVLPGIYLMVAFSMAIPLVVEKDMTPWQALSTSRKAMTHKWFQYFGFILLSSLVMIAGILAFIIGIVWTVPLVGLAYAIVYRDVFGVETKTMDAN